MRVAVLGATGKVGREVVSLIEAAHDLSVDELISGRNGDALASARLSADVLVDFSSPSAVMELLDRLDQAHPLPLVIGTTGFSDGQMERLMAEGATRAVLIGVNFAYGFGVFRSALLQIAKGLPEANLTLAETYNQAKKPQPSGTTEVLLDDLAGQGRPARVEVHRIGDTPGITEIRCDLGVTEITLRMSVAGRAAYAVGALAAARWLQRRPAGLYSPFNMLSED